jgi:hypothetical protein
MNKVLYAREGAKNMMDNMFDYFPWDIKLEIDGSKITIPQVLFCSLLLFSSHDTHDFDWNISKIGRIHKNPK